MRHTRWDLAGGNPLATTWTRSAAEPGGGFTLDEGEERAVSAREHPGGLYMSSEMGDGLDTPLGICSITLQAVAQEGLKGRFVQSLAD